MEDLKREIIKREWKYEKARGDLATDIKKNTSETDVRILNLSSRYVQKLRKEREKLEKEFESKIKSETKKLKKEHKDRIKRLEKNFEKSKNQVASGIVKWMVKEIVENGKDEGS